MDEEFTPEYGPKWSDKRVERMLGALVIAVVGLLLALIVTVFIKGWPSFAHNGLAWLLATCSDAKFRDPKQAVALAKRAVELDPNNWGYLNTLGAAYYRAGDWKAAIAALEKSMKLHKAATATTGSYWRWPTGGSARRTRPASGTTARCSGWTRTSPTMRNCAASGRRQRNCWG